MNELDRSSDGSNSTSARTAIGSLLKFRPILRDGCANAGVDVTPRTHWGNQKPAIPKADPPFLLATDNRDVRRLQTLFFADLDLPSLLFEAFQNDEFKGHRTSIFELCPFLDEVSIGTF